jgi:hypothetical protein
MTHVWRRALDRLGPKTVIWISGRFTYGAVHASSRTGPRSPLDLAPALPVSLQGPIATSWS